MPKTAKLKIVYQENIDEELFKFEMVHKDDYR